MLLPHHLNDLQKSGLSSESMAALGFRSGTADEVRAILGFEAGPGLVIPYPDTQPPFYRVKPDTPFMRKDNERRPAKYLSPEGALNRAYITPATRTALADVKVDLLLTEGEKKAAKSSQDGFPAIGIAGIWGFRDRQHDFIPDLKQIAWPARNVLLVPDSDIKSNPGVRDAVWELGWQLLQRGAHPRMIFLPPQKDDSKQGLDDYLVHSGRDALCALIADAPALVEQPQSNVGSQRWI